MKLGDFILELLDDLPGLLFLVLGCLNELPTLLNFSSENSNGVAVLLGQLDSALNLGSVCNNCIVELLAPVSI